MRLPFSKEPLAASHCTLIPRGFRQRNMIDFGTLLLRLNILCIKMSPATFRSNKKKFYVVASSISNCLIGERLLNNVEKEIASFLFQKYMCFPYWKVIAKWRAKRVRCTHR